MCPCRCEPSCAAAILELARADRSDPDSEIVEAALSQCLITMGDAGSDLPVSFRAENDHIPWTDMIALRDRLRHRYWEATADLLWSEAQAIPGLLPQIRSVLESI